MKAPRRIAMWSGPRNISTALMRSWGNRSDTIVCDEPLYAHYLKRTGRIHPGREQTIAAQPTDWPRIRQHLLGTLPGGKTIFYQKHMAHHLLSEIPRDWLSELTNCFLIRDPREMITSLLKKVPDATLADTGLPQQVEIFRQERDRLHRLPVVIDAKDVLQHPEDMLRSMTQVLGVEFSAAMLQWPPGLRETDGPWAPFWYAEVVKTTSFAPYRPKPERVPAAFGELLDSCQTLYEELAQHRLRPSSKSRLPGATKRP